MIKHLRFFALVFLACAAAPSSADIYAFVDEEGRGHFSDRPLDSRYKLYLKSPAPAAPAPAAAPAVPKPAPVRSTPPSRAAQRYAAMIAQVAKEQKLEPALLHAVIAVESAYNPRAKSRAGATGLMQLMPATAKRYGVTDLLNPLENLRAGARYLNDLLDLFDNNLKLVLAAYNAGEGAVMRSGRAIPPYPETRAYVPRVLRHYENYRAHFSAS